MKKAVCRLNLLGLNTQYQFNSKQIEVLRIGGNDPDDFIRRSMSKIMDAEVYKLYNWEGKQGKKQFKNLKTAKLILGHYF
jgi:CHAT domain-containing protein